MKRIFTLLLFFVVTGLAHGQLLITEIMYNPPESGGDSLEFLEIYNAGDAAVDVTGYKMEGVVYEFSGSIASKEIFIMANNPGAFKNVFGLDAEKFTGSLSNGGEDISIRDKDNNIIIEVVYDDKAPWPTYQDGTDGAGGSIVLCDFSKPSDAASWKVSKNATGKIINDKEVFASPGSIEDAACTPSFDGTVVETNGNTFVPKDITINVGETVRFKNTGGNHNVNGTQDAYPDNVESFTSGSPSTDLWEYDFTFTKSGVNQYKCDPHAGLGMTGTITVEDKTAAPLELFVSEIHHQKIFNFDSLNFIEFYNGSDNPIDLSKYQLKTNTVNMEMPAVSLESKSYIVLATNPGSIQKVVGNLNNIYTLNGAMQSADKIEILDKTSGTVLKTVSYDANFPFALNTSIGTCQAGASFDATTVQNMADKTYTYLNNSWTATPGTKNYCSSSIAEAVKTDADGVATQSGQQYVLEGEVIGINYRSSGLQFFIRSLDNSAGISIYNKNENFDYTVAEGDLVRVVGSVGQFRGLTQLYLDHVEKTGTDAVNDPVVVTELNESTEANLVTLENVSIKDPSKWKGSGSYNVTVTDGTTDYSVRINSVIDDLKNTQAPTGIFNITGIGSQYDNDKPYTEGYQLMPRRKSDIDPFNVSVTTYPEYEIGIVTTNNAEGVPDSLGVTCTLTGQVYGPNFRSNGLLFALIDAANDGITIFSASDNLGYTLTEGDLIQVEGKISQYNGLTQLTATKINMVSTGAINEPTLVTKLDESTESQFVRLDGLVTIKDLTQWKSDGSNSYVDVEFNGADYTVVIDNDIDLSTMEPQNINMKIQGIGSQRDKDAPYDSGYRLYPRNSSDVTFISSTENPAFETLKLVPNPVGNLLSVKLATPIQTCEVFSADGTLLIRTNETTINTSMLNAGFYMIRIKTKEATASRIFVKK